MLKAEVDAEEIAAVVSAWTGVPVARLMEGEAAKLLQMEDVMRRRVVGQDDAVRAIAGPIRRSRAGLRTATGRSARSCSSARPESARRSWPGRWPSSCSTTSGAMVRIDMGEYQERHTVARLIGAPPGYLGYDEGGQLTEAVRRRPYAVVLLDEIEKAHTDVFNILLQVLDDGPPDRRARPDGRLHQHRAHHDLEPGRGPEGLLPPGVHQPHRRDHPVPVA